MLWIIVVGLVAGILARLLSSAPNKPTGFLLTIALGIAGAFVATFIGQAVGWYHPDRAQASLLPPLAPRGAVHLEPGCRFAAPTEKPSRPAWVRRSVKRNCRPDDRNVCTHRCGGLGGSALTLRPTRARSNRPRQADAVASDGGTSAGGLPSSFRIA